MSNIKNWFDPFDSNGYNFSSRRKITEIKWIQLVMTIPKRTLKLVSKITHIYATNIMGKKIIKKISWARTIPLLTVPHFHKERIVKSRLNIKSFHKIVNVIIQDTSTWSSYLLQFSQFFVRMLDKW
jgi:hypothetical protein